MTRWSKQAPKSTPLSESEQGLTLIRIIADLHQRLGRPPTNVEIAALMAISVKRVARMRGELGL
jgi:hypothetical protein